MTIAKKTYLITGGSQGLGYEIAKLLAPENNVIIFTNHKPSLDEAIAKLKVDGYLCDITDPTQLEKNIAEIGKIDVLINNAGVWAGGPLIESDYMNIAKVIMVNTVGTIYATKAVLPVMLKQKFGKIINIGSTNGIEAKADRSVYAASKWAITGFTAALRKELEPEGISVIGINPGLMETTLHKNAEAERDYACAMKPEKVAELVKFVAELKDIVVENLTFRNLHCEFY